MLAKYYLQTSCFGLSLTYLFKAWLLWLTPTQSVRNSRGIEDRSRGCTVLTSNSRLYSCTLKLDSNCTSPWLFLLSFEILYHHRYFNSSQRFTDLFFIHYISEVLFCFSFRNWRNVISVYWFISWNLQHLSFLLQITLYIRLIPFTQIV